MQRPKGKRGRDMFKEQKEGHVVGSPGVKGDKTLEGAGPGQAGSSSLSR